jgi:putative FmdB family regulatory protein
MPMYEYECTACGHRFERIRKFSDPPVEECPNCGEHTVQKLLSSPAIQFKGTGWYITDYAKKSGTGTDAKSDASTDGSKEKDTKGSSESKESKESKESSKESKESKTTPSTTGTTSTAKASGE